MNTCEVLTCFLRDEDDSDEEDDTAELMRELERIKRERAEEKERLEHEKNASAQIARDEEIATANPLLNLAAALGQNTGVRTNAPGTFAVKRRWDDGKSLLHCSVANIHLMIGRPHLQESSCVCV